ncbi:hypothetical protein ADEAN_000131600 [Angomonas deanei]|uniref:Uncharacterized protein n=1 Tax=Angomonas deanei TaxID=59799 RepID=A0A7G2C548_9TRYP|nr:hypothetical protein ADEAN_000131600 [Angomonas deanei]
MSGFRSLNVGDKILFKVAKREGESAVQAVEVRLLESVVPNGGSVSFPAFKHNEKEENKNEKKEPSALEEVTFAPPVVPETEEPLIELSQDVLRLLNEDEE